MEEFCGQPFLELAHCLYIVCRTFSNSGDGIAVQVCEFGGLAFRVARFEQSFTKYLFLVGSTLQSYGHGMSMRCVCAFVKSGAGWQWSSGPAGIQCWGSQ